ncbi:MAG: helix-turn-helix transcriptional regulator [Acidobacteriota bacterium]
MQPHPVLHLAQKRQAKGVGIKEIANSTHISLRYLEAIEAEDFTQLPGGIYALSYIRQYAAAIGCDESAVVARYRSLLEPETPSQVGPYLQFSKPRSHNILGAFLQQVNLFVRHS